MFVVDGEARGLGANSLIGPKDFKVFHATLCALLSDIAITVDKSIEEGDWISVICSLRAKSEKTGAPVGMTGHVLVRIADGKILEGYNHWDFLGLFGQLGALPAQAFEKGLAGERIV
jgi:ketosteroid isomerase-like protein